MVHGGPGLPSRYLETLELLAGQDRRVIFYDQADPCSSLHYPLLLPCPALYALMTKERSRLHRPAKDAHPSVAGMRQCLESQEGSWRMCVL